MLPDAIVLGIGNVDWKRDITYPLQNTLVQKELPTVGKFGDFKKFIENEVQPFINATYRTNYKWIIIRQSLGGFLVMEIVFKILDLILMITIFVCTRK